MMANTITIPITPEMIDAAIADALQERGSIELDGVDITGCACSPARQARRAVATAEGVACECGRLVARWKGKPLASELEMVSEAERTDVASDLRRVADSYGREVPSGWSRNSVQSVLNVAGRASVREALLAAGAPEAGADAAARVAERPQVGDLLYEAGAGRYLESGQLSDMMHVLNEAVTSDVEKPCATRHPVRKVTCALPEDHHGLCLSRVADDEGRWLHWWRVGGREMAQKGGV